jgi:hypothetical protein
MAKRLTKRTAPASSETPKPLPARGEEAQPETFTCPEVKPEKTKPAELCSNCRVFPSHSQSDHLCYNCHRESKGFVFDAEAKRFIKEK